VEDELFGSNTFVLILIGIAAGIISGMGMGGGAILIPALILTVKPEQHIAQSVNLLFFVPTAIVALIIHIRNRNVDFKIAFPIISAGLCGALLGSWLAVGIEEGNLKKLFGFFLLVMSVYEMFRKGKTDGKAATNAVKGGPAKK